MGIELKQTPTGGLGGWDDLSGAQGAIVLTLSTPVNRGATNTQTIGALPANARIISIVVTNPVVSNAGTTATVSVGLSGGSATYFTAAQDVKTAVGTFMQAATAGWVQSAASQAISVTYTETGTASTAGTAYVQINYCVV